MSPINQELEPNKPPTADDYNAAADRLIVRISGEPPLFITDQGEVAPAQGATAVGFLRQRAKELTGEFPPDYDN